MIRNHSLEHDEGRLIDAIVDGEMQEPKRSDFLRRLEQSPCGWRRLSLAFLEAQAWRQALRSEGSQMSHRRAATIRVRGQKRAVWAGAWAVSALLTFSLGFLASGGFRNSPPVHSRATAMEDNSKPSSEVRVAGPEAQTAAMARTLSPAARQKLERLGFRVHERPRVVSVLQPDGHTVQVLVHEVELHFVGRQYSL